jgi:hypothetical protein
MFLNWLTDVHITVDWSGSAVHVRNKVWDLHISRDRETQKEPLMVVYTEASGLAGRPIAFIIPHSTRRGNS